MNLEERLAQVRKDKSLLETEEKEILKRIEKQKVVPIISFATHTIPDDRIVINFSEKMIECIKNGAKQIVICSDGSVGDHRKSHTLSCNYINQEPVFGEIKWQENSR